MAVCMQLWRQAVGTTSIYVHSFAQDALNLAVCIVDLAVCIVALSGRYVYHQVHSTHVLLAAVVFLLVTGSYTQKQRRLV